jgi:hypothetical protein
VVVRTQAVPAVNGLDGKRGTFESRHGAVNNRFGRHGAVRISASKRFFEHADGTPFFWMGDTVWYGASLSSTSGWNAYLSDRASKRFNVVYFNVVAPRNGVAADENREVSFEGAEHFEMPSRVSQLITKGFKLAGLESEKPVRVNPRFYQRLDERTDAVNAQGLLAVLTWG